MVLVRGGALTPRFILAQVRREQKITLGEMRATGLRRLLFIAKTTSALTTSKISAEQWPDHIRLSHLEPLFVCQVCGHKGADVRPLFDRERMPEANRMAMARKNFGRTRRKLSRVCAVDGGSSVIAERSTDRAQCFHRRMTLSAMPPPVWGKGNSRSRTLSAACVR
jgi:hypothetical protein